jgi:hypothetical protein
LSDRLAGRYRRNLIFFPRINLLTTRRKACRRYSGTRLQPPVLSEEFPQFGQGLDPNENISDPEPSYEPASVRRLPMTAAPIKAT